MRVRYGGIGSCKTLHLGIQRFESRRTDCILSGKLSDHQFTVGKGRYFCLLRDTVFLCGTQGID